MFLASDALTLLDIVCKNTNKINKEFALYLDYHLFNPSPGDEFNS